MSEIVFTRGAGWIPTIVRDDSGLRVELGAGADALHQPRTFSFPISEAHADVIRSDLRRHLLLWIAVLPLCDAAGISRPLDEAAAVALLDPILLGDADDVDAWFRETRTDTTRLVAHGADIRLLERGQVVDSLHDATTESDTPRLQAYAADRRRARRGVRLAPLDTAVLTYTGQLRHGSTLPTRRPDDVDPDLLPEVLRVIDTAEQACTGLRVRRDPSRGERAPSRRDWKRMAKSVEKALRRAHPRLVDDTVRSVTFLMCSEALDRDLA